MFLKKIASNYKTNQKGNKYSKGNTAVVFLLIIIILICVSFFIPNITTSFELKERARIEKDKLLARLNKDKNNSDSNIQDLNNQDTKGESPEGKVLGSAISEGEDINSVISDNYEKVTHVLPPKAVKAVYMSSWVAGSPKLRNKIVDLIDKTELNAVVIDIKDYTGMISFKTNSDTLNSVDCIDNRISDVKDFIRELHDKNIYVIGRVAVFQDPCLVKKWPESAVKRISDGGIWKDRNGITWMDAGAQDVWDYNIEIARESHRIGFDEINWDYIRYPTDGNMKDIAFPVSGTRSKALTLEGFFKYIDKELRGGRASSSSDPVFDELVIEYDMGISTTAASMADITHDGVRVETSIDNMPRAIISADLFGLVTNNTDDMGIGQVLVRAAPYVDFIGPMVYPSHYPNNFIGLKNPAQYPYQVVLHAMKGGVTQLKNKNLSPLKLRPWLQDFNLGATYTSDMVRKQIKATYDSGLTSWMLWDASNTYTAGGALNITDIVATQ